MNESRVLQITKDLVQFASISSTSNEAISDYVQKFLERLKFDVERLTYRDARDQLKVSLVAKRGHGTRGLAYLAHTDVVPADDWVPTVEAAFQPRLDGKRLYGRGTCDMKGSLAAALVAAEQISPNDQTAPMYFVVTSDEETGMQGAQMVRDESKCFRDMVSTHCVGIVGEPTTLNVIYAHKGTLVLTVRSIGRSAHSSSAAGINANDRLFAALPELQQIKLQTENDPTLRNYLFDPPILSWNWVVRNDPCAANVTAGMAELRIFIRPMPHVDHAPIVEQVAVVAQRHGLEFTTSAGTSPLATNLQSPFVASMLRLTKTAQAHTACYATDGGVLQDLHDLVVCGPGDIAQAHCNYEWIAVEQLVSAVDLYQSAFHEYCVATSET